MGPSLGFRDLLQSPVTIREIACYVCVIAIPEAGVVMPTCIYTSSKPEISIENACCDVWIAGVESGVYLVPIDEVHVFIIDEVFCLAVRPFPRKPTLHDIRDGRLKISDKIASNAFFT
jgi:hypothetical protein